MKIGVAKNSKKVFFFFDRKNIEIHPIWLRERVTNPELMDVNNGQRLYESSNINNKLKIQSAFIKRDNLSVKFSDGIESKYKIKDLLNELNKTNNPKVFLWDTKLKKKPIFNFKTKMFEKKEGLIFLKNFYKYGFAIVKNTPQKKKLCN